MVAMISGYIRSSESISSKRTIVLASAIRNTEITMVIMGDNFQATISDVII